MFNENITKLYGAEFDTRNWEGGLVSKRCTIRRDNGILVIEYDALRSPEKIQVHFAIGPVDGIEEEHFVTRFFKYDDALSVTTILRSFEELAR